MYTLFEVLNEPSDTTEDLISLEDAKLELGVTDDDDDDLISRRIARASDIIEEITDRRFAFAEAEETFVFDGDVYGRRLGLVLRLYPVEEVTSITIDGVALDASAYDVQKDAGIIRLRERFAEWCGARSAEWCGTPTRVVVTYSGGYMLPDEAPGALQQATLMLVRQAEAASAASTGASAEAAGIKGIQHGDTSVTFSTGSTSSSSSSSSSTSVIPALVLDLLGPFKRPAIA